jgi:hypothetical protein
MALTVADFYYGYCTSAYYFHSLDFCRRVLCGLFFCAQHGIYYHVRRGARLMIVTEKHETR